MKKPHLILDYESVGPYVLTNILVNCAYYVFDFERLTSDNPYTFEELISEIKFDKMDIAYQNKVYGRKMKKADLDWWSKQGPTATIQLKPSANDITIEKHLDNVIEYIKSHKKKMQRWWSRSNAFDPVILMRCCDDVYGSQEPLNAVLDFWKMRDTRTYIDTRFNFDVKRNGFCPFIDEAKWKEVFKAHNPIHDIAADILRIQKIERIIEDKELKE